MRSPDARNVRRAANRGHPVKLMGFDVGWITRIEAQPPEDFYYNVYVEFVIKAPHYGYLWSGGSRVRERSTGG